jgi:ABC-type polysaccharide/polyol phosphate transport system ATPase subunit
VTRPPAIEIDGIGKRFRLDKAPRGVLGGARRRRGVPRPPSEVWALRDVTLDVAAGETLGVIGPNGAGKTTLLKVLARVTAPTTGRAVVRGRVVPLLRLGAGFNREYTGRDNAFLSAAMLGIPRAIVERRMPDIVEFAGLERFIDTPVKHYSSGMYTRLAFAVAINLDPEVLLADEVLAVGDAEFQARCMDRLAASAGEAGTTVLFVSHDLDAVARLCDRVMRLDRGRLVAVGTPEDVIAGYQDDTRTVLERAALPQRREPAPGAPQKRRVWLQRAALAAPPGRTDAAPAADEDVAIEVEFEHFGWRLEITCILLVESAGHVAFAAEAPTVGGTVPGRHRARMTIPAHTLAARAYDVSIEFRSCKRGTNERTESHPRVLSFRCHESAADRATGLGDAGDRGLLAPAVHWAIEPLPATDAARAGASSGPEAA